MKKKKKKTANIAHKNFLSINISSLQQDISFNMEKKNNLTMDVVL